MTRPEDPAAHCIKDLLRKVPQLDREEIEDVVLGCAQPHGPQAHNIARTSAMLAGLPTSVAGTTINRTWATIWLVPACALAAAPFGIAPAAIQPTMPATMRGQASGIYLFFINLIGLGIGADRCRRAHAIWVSKR
jgi:hypothetical protein